MKERPMWLAFNTLRTTLLAEPPLQAMLRSTAADQLEHNKKPVTLFTTTNLLQERGK